MNGRYDADHAVRLHAVQSLNRYGPQATAAVSPLLEVVLDSKQREPMRQWAIMTLVETRPERRSEVVAGVIQASRDKGNYGVSSLAKQQVKKLDPDAAQAAGLR